MPFFIQDHGSCERNECEHFDACCHILAAASDAVREAMKRQQRIYGVVPPLRGFLPCCPWRDARRQG